MPSPHKLDSAKYTGVLIVTNEEEESMEQEYSAKFSPSSFKLHLSSNCVPALGFLSSDQAR
jgi:hypothetical protein